MMWAMRLQSNPPPKPEPATPQSRGSASSDEPSTQSVVRRSTFALMLFWLVFMGVLYLGMQQYLKPAKAKVLSNGTVLIPRAKDGHFRVQGSVNGQKVNFMVDTGASTVSVTDELANRAGLTGGEVTRFRTANGDRMGRIVRAEDVRVGPLVVSGVRVGTGYTGEDDEDALLGQAFLRHFDVQIRSDEMLLQSKSSSSIPSVDE